MRNSILLRTLIVLITFAMIPKSVFAQWQTDNTYGFKINIPSDWSKTSTMDGTDILYDYYSPDENLAIQIRAFEASPQLTVNLLAQVYEDNYLAEGTQKMALDEHISKNGIPGLQGVYTMNYNGLEVAIMIFYAVQNNNGYVLNAFLPTSMVEQRGDDLKSILRTFTLEGFQAVEAPPEPVQPPASISAFGDMASGTTPATQTKHITLVVDDAGIEFSMPADFGLHEKEPGQSIYLNPAGDMKMIIQTVYRDNGNTMETIAQGIAEQIQGNANANMLFTGNKNFGNMRSKVSSYEFRQGTTTTYFNYVYIDAPGNIMALGFVSSSDLMKQNDLYFETACQSLKRVAVKTVPTAAPTPSSASGNNAGLVGMYNFVSRSDGKLLLNYHFIDVKSDGTYKEEYQLKSTGNYVGGNEGTWQLNGDVLTLTMDGGISDEYMVKGSQLIRTSGGGIIFTFSK